MTFKKDLMFLGMQENKFQDGSSYYKLSFFDQESNTPVSVNIGGNSELLTSLKSFNFGSVVLCQLGLVEKDKLYKLTLRAVAAK